MAAHPEPAQREVQIAKVFRALGDGPLSLSQAKAAAKLLGVSWSTVYRLRKRFLADPVASSLRPQAPGPSTGARTLAPSAERIVDAVLTQWLPRQRQLAHPMRDVTMEVRRNCKRAGIKPVSRATVARRWEALRAQQALALANEPGAAIPPGHLIATKPLELVQIDHTQADLFVVDEATRRAIGRPWLSVAIDVASRAVVGIYLAMERPNAATVALLLTRVALPKAAWLASLGLADVEWPMSGVPQTLHLDNAAEFKSRALRSGCREYGIELTYRPVRRPQFGGHIERLNRTLMDRLRGLPGATVSIEARRTKRVRPPEQTAQLTLREFEQWLALEIAQRYHHSEHRGLMGATPASAWQALAAAHALRALPSDPSKQLRFLVQFLPMATRTIQHDGLTIFYLRYWHPIFAAWRETRSKVSVRYHPEDLSRLFVSADGKSYVEARFADLRRPRISLWEQRMARKALRASGSPDISEALIFKTIERQRRIVASASSQTRRMSAVTASTRRSRLRDTPWPETAPATGEPKPEVDYSQVPEESYVEVW
ncbi:DDE-type integrase/transposase/recombinase [Variovorax sp. LjRoot290]|uniref:Mu transposase C-terminal domain-containing protein n=1 Tax=unclassified Variovorax TaxID=663243 RepID=UPI003ECD6170